MGHSHISSTNTFFILIIEKKQLHVLLQRDESNQCQRVLEVCQVRSIRYKLRQSIFNTQECLLTVDFSSFYG